MPRPSLRTQRSEEILDAYMTCVARFGLEGATQERVAAEAGVKRPLLRHYLGNRDQMIVALSLYVANTFNNQTAELDFYLSEIESGSQLVEILFTDDEEIDPRLLAAWQALSTSIGDHPDLAKPLLAVLSRFLLVIEKTLRRVSPNASAEKVRAVAQGISTVFLSLDSLAALDAPSDWRLELKQAALLLTETLDVSD
ncbi:TetR/AcrR family transcriptional regulator [Ruegeria sp. Ofav3-42]|uniref:TetR/AcrR family transcriptional regulator n=1 Tax=Ruegeria sp. Ofav3-42 TaxID=2917759 RepID=UPI001EF5F238|nr:TetR/AcrR family transcriptional regulator [Ruegeria sp. Ofav3-42]MCG7519947.1 TetR/AcrR family transcriptional regulator [Ruegeria sp. Ofav3-42]